MTGEVQLKGIEGNMCDSCPSFLFYFFFLMNKNEKKQDITRTNSGGEFNPKPQGKDAK